VSRLAPYWLALDILVALALGVLAQVAVWQGHVAGPRLLIAPLFLLVGPPLVIRRRLPLVPLVGLMGAIVVQALVSQDAAEGPALVFTGLVAVYSIAAWGSRQVALVGLAVTAAALIVSGLEDRHIHTGEQVWSAAFFYLTFFAAWVAGLFIHSRREAAALGWRAAQLERERSEAIAAERAGSRASCTT
jgi:hypothetical protein